MKIPKIIHQTWKNLDIPEDFKALSLSWQQMHPDWKYCLWTDEMNRNLIKEHFPEFLIKYDSYPFNIQRVDAIKYFILKKYGGVYIDLDFECLSNIEALIGNANCLFGKEPLEHCRWHHKDAIISNAFIASIPENNFIENLCIELHIDHEIENDCNDEVLESTGPFMLTRKYNEYSRKEEISVVEYNLLFPLTKDELFILSDDKKAGQLKENLSQAFAIHHYAGTWWKNRV